MSDILYSAGGFIVAVGVLVEVAHRERALVRVADATAAVGG